MTHLVFSIDERRFALPATEVVAVVPVTPLRAIDGTPAWVAGLLAHLGTLVPVVDLCWLHAGRPARPAFASRIVIARYPRPGGGERHLGLLAEHVTDVAQLAPDAWQDPGLAMPDTPWLGPVADLGGGVLAQRVSVPDLLPQDVRDRLFP